MDQKANILHYILFLTPASPNCLEFVICEKKWMFYSEYFFILFLIIFVEVI